MNTHGIPQPLRARVKRALRRFKQDPTSGQRAERVLFLFGTVAAIRSRELAAARATDDELCPELGELAGELDHTERGEVMPS